MGYAIARAAQEAGAQVTLVSGPVALEAPYQVRRINVETARQMHATVMSQVDDADIFISVAAVADWYVSNASDIKIKKTSEQATPDLQFSPNPDILAEVAALKNGPFCVGFAAETDNLIEHAQAKRQRKNVPLLVANLAQRAMNADDTELVLFDEQGHMHWPAQDKLLAARQLVQDIAQRL